MRRPHFALALLLFLAVPLALAANNPGHDSLYIQKTGDTVSGNFNVTGTAWMQGITYIQDYLNILANGTTPTPTYAQIAATSTALYIDSPGDLYLNSLGGGGTGTTFIGTTGDTVSLNITGNLTVQGAMATISGQAICLANGTGCPDSLGGGNVTSVAEQGTTPLTISPTTGNVQISITVPNCNNPTTSKLLYNSTDGSFYCGTDSSGVSSENDPIYTANNASLWAVINDQTANISSLQASNTTAGSRINWLNSSKLTATANACSAGNYSRFNGSGFECETDQVGSGPDGTGGWTNSTTNTSTSLKVVLTGTGQKEIGRDRTNGSTALLGGSTQTEGAYFQLTGQNYTATSPGRGSAEFVIRNIAAESRFALFSYDGASAWTERFKVWGETGDVSMAANGGEVGIGTSHPNSTLHVYQVSGSNAEIALQGTSGANQHWAFYIDRPTNNFKIWRSTDVLVFENRTGNLGIGLQAPSQRLDVNGSINISGTSGKLYAPEICLNGICSSSWSSVGGDGTGGWTNNSQNTTTTLNVGIGTASPLYNLHVYNNVSSPLRASLLIENPNPINPIAEFRLKTGRNQGDEWIISNQGNSEGEFAIIYNTGVPSLFIMPSGNVGIGLAAGVMPSQKLQVNGSVNITGASKLYVPEICLAGVCQAEWPSGATGGWTNTSTDTSTGLNVNISGLARITGGAIISTVNVTSNLTMNSNKVCYTSDCAVYVYYNGTCLIEQGPTARREIC